MLLSSAEAGQFEVTRVYEGDSFKAAGLDIEIKVRMVGIDAPETSKQKNQPGQPYSQKAKKRLADLILNKTVKIEKYGLGPYGRVLGEIFIDATNVNLLMIREGLAKVYRGRPPRGFDVKPYTEAELQAKLRIMGVWTLMDEYVSPKDWRKMKK